MRDFEQGTHQNPSSLLNLQNTEAVQTSELNIMQKATPQIRAELLKAQGNATLFNQIAKNAGL